MGFEPTVRLSSVQTISSRPRYDRFGTSPQFQTKNLGLVFSLFEAKSAFFILGIEDIKIIVSRQEGVISPHDEHLDMELSSSG